MRRVNGAEAGERLWRAKIGLFRVDMGFRMGFPRPMPSRSVIVTQLNFKPKLLQILHKIVTKATGSRGVTDTA